MPKFFLQLSLISVITRTLYLLQQIPSPFFAKPLLDQHYYDLCAQQLAGAGGNIIDGFRPLLYPLFLSAFYAIDLDGGILLSIIAQHLLGIGLTVLIAAIAMRLFNNTKAGIFAGLLFCLSSPPLYFEGQLLIATLFSFLLLLLWFVVFQALDHCSTRQTTFRWFASGLVLGLAVQARPNALPLILFFPLLTILRSLQHQTNIAKNQGLTFKLSPLLAIPGLLMIQVLFGTINAKYSGDFSLMTQAGGINFYLGNSLKADGMIPKQDRHVVYEGEYRDPIQVMAEQGYREDTGKLGHASQKETSDHWKQKTLDEIKSAPGRWIKLMIKKSWLMFWNHEVPNNRSFEFAATHDTPLLRWLPVRWWLLLALFPWGIAALLKKGQKELVLWILSFVILFSGTIILFFVNSRFRIPLWPGMSIVAAGGAVHLWESIQAKRIPKIPALFSLILLPLSLFNWFGIPSDPIENDLSMRANAYYEQGRYTEAFTDIEKCIHLAPNNPRYYFIQGNILLASKNNTTAISAYLKAISLNSTDPMFHNNLGIAFENSGDFNKAEIAYKKALELYPQNRSAKTNLMLLMIHIGNTETAKAMLKELLSAEPKNPTLLCALSVLKYKKTGNTDALKHANQLNPVLTEQLTK